MDVEIREIPDAEPTDPADAAPLASYRKGSGQRTAVLVVYRRPVELRAPDRLARIDLVRDLVAEQLADLLGISPTELDPAYDDGGDS